MTKSEGIGHPLKVRTIEDFGPSNCSGVFEPGNMAWSIAGLSSNLQRGLADRRFHECA